MGWMKFLKKSDSFFIYYSDFKGFLYFYILLFLEKCQSIDAKLSNVKVKGGGNTAVYGKPVSELQSITCHMRSQCYLPPDTRERTSPLPQPDKPVLDLLTLEGWKAELT